jgi:hypothetical protein
MTVFCSDILVQNHGSIVILRAASPAGKAWIEQHVDRDGQQPFPAGTRIVEPRYLPSIVAGAREAGLEVS